MLRSLRSRLPCVGDVLIRRVHGMSVQPQFIDIGVNLTDPSFGGLYHGKQAHPEDFETVLSRARKAGVVAQLLTGGSLEESKDALGLARCYEGFYSTAGCHPTRTSEMEACPDGPQMYLSRLSELIRSSQAGTSPSKIVAVGECGLDYDRLHFAPASVQREHFASQLDLAVQHKLPLFLHSRAAHADFVDILKSRLEEIHSALTKTYGVPLRDDANIKRVGVVHSFTGTVDEVKELLALGLFIGINGCSLKTLENLDVIKHIPLSRIMLETGEYTNRVARRFPLLTHLALYLQMRPGVTLARHTLRRTTFSLSRRHLRHYTLRISRNQSRKRSGPQRRR